MLQDLIKQWPGVIEIDGKKYEKQDALSKLAGDVKDVKNILLLSHAERATERNKTRFTDTPQTVYRVTVRQYMTKPANPNFDFMAKWNNNIPMPLRTMVGTVEKETPGMVYMKLHGDITGTITQHCMKCGRPITNSVSQYFGMGPECGGHNYVNPFESDEDLKEAVEKYRREYLQKIKWEGWIIKSSIIEQEAIE